MKRTTRHFALGAAATPLILASSSTASFIGLIVEQLPLDDSPGILTFRIYAQFDGTQGQGGGDFVFSVAGKPAVPLAVNVHDGTYFQHAANTHGGGDLSPHPSLCASDPTVCMDTFVTIGKDTSIGDATQLAPGWAGFEPDRLSSPSGWYITPKDKQGLPDQEDRVLLMQLSSQDGVGFFGTFLLTGFSNGEIWQEGVRFDTSCFVDIDGDNVVGIDDLLVVINEWGACPTRCPGDVTANGNIGILDLLEVLAHWGPCS